MSGRNGRVLTALRGLGLGIGAISIAAIAVLVWRQGATTSELRERAYPVPHTECGKAKNCDNRALKIQAREAVTSDAVMDIVLGQLVLGILGLGGVGYTVYYARLAWKEAQAALAHDRSASERELRAYVALERIEMTRKLDGTIEAQPVWRNGGQTPTVSARCGIGRREQPTALPEDFDYPNAADDPPEAISLPPVGERMTRGPTLQLQLLTDIAGEKTFFHLYGWIEYRDVFDHTPPRRSEYCCRLQLNLPNGPLGPNGRWMWTSEGPFNGMDKECFRAPGWDTL